MLRSGTFGDGPSRVRAGFQLNLLARPSREPAFSESSVTARSTRRDHGTRLELDGAHLGRVIDRGGVVHATLAWDGDGLVGLEVGWPPAGDGRVTVEGDTMSHLLFGRAHAVSVAGGGRTTMGAVTWAHPTQIPPIEHPARLPGGAGSTILNLIALLAERAGVDALRYAGPYPTAALWQALGQSFRPLGDEATFTADALARATAARMTPVAVDFVPAPFERVRVGPGVVAQLRDQLERVWIGAEVYPAGGGVRRLVRTDQGWAAEVWLGGAPWARLAELTGAGELRAGLTPLPPVTSPVVGQSLPAALLVALAELIVDAVAAPLADAVRAELATARVAWGDPGAAAVRDDGAVILVHAALWDRLAPRGLAEVGLALAEALAGPIAARAQARLAASLVAR